MGVPIATGAAVRSPETDSLGATVALDRTPGLHVVLFVGLTLSLAGLAAIGSAAVPAAIPFALAIGPALVAIVLAWREGNGALGRLLSLLRRRPADRRWYLVLLVPVLGTLAVVPLAVASGIASSGLFDKLTPAALIVPLVVLLPAFAEELAWRGYALVRLLAVTSPLVATLLLAVPWTVMHLVLYLPGQMYDGIAVWPTLVTVPSLAILGSWIFIQTGGSVLMTGLFHALFNGATPLLWGLPTETSWQLRPVVFAAIAIAVVALGGLRAIGGGVSTPAPARVTAST